jgi:hypothetical protein
MKYQVTVWTLSWDTRSGTDCRVFGSYSEWYHFFSSIIESDIEGIETQQVDEMRSLLLIGEIGLVYEIWQENYKSELDTYNWDSSEITIEISDTNIRAIA